MKNLIISEECFQREKLLQNTQFRMIENSFQLAEVFLLKEMLRKLYFVNKKINEKKEEDVFSLFFSQRIIENYDTFIQKINEFKEMSEKPRLGVHLGHYGFPIASSYTMIEIMKYNDIYHYDENLYEYGIRCMERGYQINKETYPKSFEIGGLYRIPIDLMRYTQEVPYIINTSDAYLDAINNYYKQYNTTDYEKYQPQWLLDDNLRGVISNEYKKWL